MYKNMLICQCHHQVKPMLTHFFFAPSCTIVLHGCKGFYSLWQKQVILHLWNLHDRAKNQHSSGTDWDRCTKRTVSKYLLNRLINMIRYLADGSCSEPILGFAGPPGSSTLSLTSNESWVHALQYLWVALRACKLQGEDEYSNKMNQQVNKIACHLYQ